MAWRASTCLACGINACCDMQNTHLTAQDVLNGSRDDTQHALSCGRCWFSSSSGPDSSRALLQLCLRCLAVLAEGLCRISKQLQGWLVALQHAAPPEGHDIHHAGVCCRGAELRWQQPSTE
jgi:hypothetical protein